MKEQKDQSSSKLNIQQSQQQLANVQCQNQKKSLANKNNMRNYLGMFSIMFLIIIVSSLLLLKKQSKIQQETNDIDDQIDYTQDQLQKTILQLQKRPLTFKQQPTFKFKPTKFAYFAYNIYKNPSRKNLLAQYYYYDKKYKIGSQKYQKQLPICIVSVGRNLVFQQRYQRFLQSISRLNYTNFKIILIDDASTDGTTQKINQYFQKLSPLKKQLYSIKQKMKLITQTKRMYALWNRNYALKNFCKHQEIVVQIDPDDQFIGKQTLKYINSIYHNSNVWVFYSNYVYWSPLHAEPTEGISGKIPNNLLSNNIYRTSNLWVTSATRTFRQKLYSKINENDFIDMNFPQYQSDGNLNKDKYYKWCADLFMHYSLIELAGPEHYAYSQQIFYYYHLDHNPYETLSKKLDKFTSFTIEPYLPLKNLDDQSIRFSEIKDNYQAPQWLEEQKRKLKKEIDQKNMSI